MKALFIHTRTNEVMGHVSAWESVYGPCAKLAFDHTGIRNDHLLLEAACDTQPSVIFYIGACKALGNPRPDTLIELRSMARLVNLVSDAADRPWHPVLAGYRSRGCFDLQVSIDGGREYIDHATLTPVDTRYFEGPEVERDIRCGFSGSVGRWNNRSEIVNALEWFGGLTVRRRELKQGEGYADHAAFMRRCRMILNVSYTGSQQAHHIKGRVLEAGWAGACLLEMEGSPIGEWVPANKNLPTDCYFTYRDPREAAVMIRDLSDYEIMTAASNLSRHVRQQYSPAKIYGGILEKLGLVVPAVAA